MWVIGYIAIFGVFADYDDEGYMLIMLKHFHAEGHLYDRVFSQYGPLYHQLFAAVFALPGLHTDHDTGRLVTLVVWVATSLLVALLTLRLTHSGTLPWPPRSSRFCPFGA